MASADISNSRLQPQGHSPRGRQLTSKTRRLEWHRRIVLCPDAHPLERLFNACRLRLSLSRVRAFLASTDETDTPYTRFMADQCSRQNTRACTKNMYSGARKADHYPLVIQRKRRYDATILRLRGWIRRRGCRGVGIIGRRVEIGKCGRKKGRRWVGDGTLLGRRRKHGQAV